MGFFGWLKGDKPTSSPSSAAKPPAPTALSSSEPAPPVPQPEPIQPRTTERIIDDFTPLTDAYVAAQGGSDSAVAYFRKFFALSHISAIPAIPPGETPASMIERGKVYGPICVEEDGRLMMCLFTSSARAHAAAKRNGLVSASDPFGILSLAMPQAMSMFLQSKVDGFVINPDNGDLGVTMPLPGMASMYEFITDSLPPEGLRPFLINETSRPSAWGQVRVARRLIKDVKTLFFAGDTARPGSPLPYVGKDGGAFLCIFTDQQAVAAGAHMIVQPGGTSQTEQEVSLIPTNPIDALAYADRLMAHSQGAVREFVINIGPASTVVHFDAWRQALSELTPGPHSS